jgi:hypothetical protein
VLESQLINHNSKNKDNSKKGSKRRERMGQRLLRDPDSIPRNLRFPFLSIGRGQGSSALLPSFSHRRTGRSEWWSRPKKITESPAKAFAYGGAVFGRAAIGPQLSLKMKFKLKERKKLANTCRLAEYRLLFLAS